MSRWQSWIMGQASDGVTFGCDACGVCVQVEPGRRYSLRAPEGWIGVRAYGPAFDIELYFRPAHALDVRDAVKREIDRILVRQRHPTPPSEGSPS